MVWGNFKATCLLVLVHDSRSDPIIIPSHTMATLLLAYFTLTQTSPYPHPLWWPSLSLPRLKPGFSLKTSFIWGCSWLIYPVLQIRRLFVLLILVSNTVGKNLCSFGAHAIWLCYPYPSLLSIHEPFITYYLWHLELSLPLYFTSCHHPGMPSSSQIMHKL